MNIGARQITSLEVLENFLGAKPTKSAISRLSDREIGDLELLVLQSCEASAWEPSPPGAIYPGGWLANDVANPAGNEYLNLALLYYPKVLIHDPLGDFFFGQYRHLPDFRPLRAADGSLSISAGPEMWHQGAAFFKDSPETLRARLGHIAEFLSDIEPLLRDNIVVMRSQWPIITSRIQPLMASVRHDSRNEEFLDYLQKASEDEPFPVWDNIRGLRALPATPLRAADKRWRFQYESFYLAKTLAVADAVGATYVPASDVEMDVLRLKLKATFESPPSESQPISFLQEVARVSIPNLAITAKTAVAMRNSEQDFDDWHRSLDRLRRSTDPDSWSEQVADELIPDIRRVERAIRRSPLARSALKEAAASTIISATTSGLVAATATGSPITSMAAAGGAGALNWLWRAYFPSRLGGRDAVIAALVRSG